MKNQHTLISGYRDLTQEEIDLMNEIKQMEARVLALVQKVERKLDNQMGEGETLRMSCAHPYRWADTARTDLEKGFMSLVRSVAQPQPLEVESE